MTGSHFELLNIKVHWVLPLSGYVFWSRVFIVPRYRKKYNIKIDSQTNIDSVSREHRLSFNDMDCLFLTFVLMSAKFFVVSVAMLSVEFLIGISSEKQKTLKWYYKHWLYIENHCYMMHMIYIENHCPMMYMTSLSVCGISCVESFANHFLGSGILYVHYLWVPYVR